MSSLRKKDKNISQEIFFLYLSFENRKVRNRKLKNNPQNMWIKNVSRETKIKHNSFE